MSVKRRYLCLMTGIMLAAVLAAGCAKKEEIPADSDRNSQILCGKVESVDGDEVVLEVGAINDFGDVADDDAQQNIDCFGGVLTFTPNGEQKIIEIADDAVITTMNGVKKTEATVADVGTGDILAVTLSQNLAVTVVIHPAELSDTSS